MDPKKMRACLQQQSIPSAKFDIANLLFDSFSKPMDGHHGSTVDGAKICFPNGFAVQRRTFRDYRFTEPAIVLFFAGQFLTIVDQPVK